MNAPKKEPQGDPFLIAFGIYGAIGFQLAAAVVGGLLFGSWLDKKFNTPPWLTLIGLLLGSIGGFYNLLKLLTWKEKRKG
jgi:ATP synthase protein I